ncbi:AMP-binding protein [Algihabitans albus]|uniref:AMP-binding protein n=1 Tax=Algihabitans albus TaxID=2164067 RepID=UPI000E5C79FB|nr:AMP-binding protein [Algihabitans albus]
MNLVQLLVRTARGRGERAAIVQGAGTPTTYSTLARRAACLGASLRGRFDLVPGDRVALAMKNCPAYLEVLYGCWWAGLVPVPMNAKLHPRELAYMLGKSGARLCFVTPDLATDIRSESAGLDRLQEVIEVEAPLYRQLLQSDPMHPADRDLDDLAWLFFTSGTTGRPKGAMITHRNLWTMTSCYFPDVDAVGPDDALVYAAPMSHGAGLYNFPYMAQAALHVIPESGGFDPAEFIGLMKVYRGLGAFFAPTMIKRLVEHADADSAPTANLNTLVYGGGPMYVTDLKQALEVFGNRFVQIYGQGESPMCITSLTRDQHAEIDHPAYETRLASVGRAQMLVELRVADEDDRSLPPGEVGEVLVRGPSVIPGYWQDEAASAQTLKGGWLHTGDMASLDEDGFLTLKDRSKDVIISGGTNIYPREVEEVLLRHPKVAEVAVIGRPHPDWGEEVVAVVVARKTAAPSEDELNRLCLEHIARFKRPKGYRFVAALPKNNYGKVLKTELRALLEADERSRET